MTNDVCSYCGKPATNPVKRVIWVNHGMQCETFCSKECAKDRQMGAEG